MRISTVGRYALRAMVDLALHSGQGPVLCKDIAQRQEISNQYLSQLLLKLRRAELLHSVRGPGGGYTLARDAAAISVRDILRAVDETLAPVFCVDDVDDSTCELMDGCPTHWFWARLGGAIDQIADSVTLAELCARAVNPTPELDASRQISDRTKTSESTEVQGKLFSTFDSLEAAYAFLQSIVDGVAEPIMVIGTDYRVKLMNRAACEFSSGGGHAPESALCYQVSHHRETPCRGSAHPCPLLQVHQTGQPVTVVHEHYQADGERRLVELIASPLWGPDGQCQGIIESARDVTERARAEEALQQYAERLRALAERLDEVAEAERQRLARELHDQVGQNLTALGINLNIVRTQMPRDAVPAVHSRLDDSLLLVQQTTERIRNVMSDLRPPVLDDYGLLAALHWYAEQFSRRTSIAVAVENDERVPRLDERVESALFRIAQEALINVAKHAQASHVTVSLEVGGKALRLLVVDDGVGFDAVGLAEPGRGRGWGLLTMAERAEAVGGRCSIESYPGLGTRVIVEVAQ